jgi:hypothetical protein
MCNLPHLDGRDTQVIKEAPELPNISSTTIRSSLDFSYLSSITRCPLNAAQKVIRTGLRLRMFDPKRPGRKLCSRTKVSLQWEPGGSDSAPKQS